MMTRHRKGVDFVSYIFNLDNNTFTSVNVYINKREHQKLEKLAVAIEVVSLFNTSY